jgi:uncharacterized Zn ribbon protein
MSDTQHGELRHGDTVVFVKGLRVGHKATFLRYTENDGVMLDRGRDTIFCLAENVEKAGGDDPR